jgi:hypothetical protein
MGNFQEGMRNANGSARRAKFSIRPYDVPASARPIEPVTLAPPG